MKLRIIGLLVMMFAVAAALPAQARPEVVTPATFRLSDSYKGFCSPTVVSRHGKFDVSIGESHEGDPGFDGLSRGAEFEIAIAIYHLEPNRPGLPYVSTYVTVARGRNGVSVAPAFRGVKRITYKRTTFEISIVKLSTWYGKGKTVLQVRAL